MARHVLACVLALVAAAAVISEAGAASAQDVNTTAAANDTICPFGVPDTSTYGQTITIPAGVSSIASFGFEMANVPATVDFRGEIYLWDAVNSLATGAALYESSVTSTTGATPQLVTFTPAGGVPVTPGQQYVIFASTSRDHAGASGTGCWEHSSTDLYPSGEFVFLNDGGDASQWTTQSWTAYGGDLGFVVTFDAAPAIPTLTEWAMILFSLGLAGSAAVHLQRRRRVI